VSDASTGDTARIRAVGLSKTYPGSTSEAVAGLDLEVASGELFGLVGPNGAGKSTTIGMLTTLIRPTGGRAWVGGADVVREPARVKQRIGVSSQANTLDQELTVAENLEFGGRWHGMPARVARRRAAELVEAFGLTERARAMAGQLSGGQAQRTMIARSLIHRPEVLFLDEPTAGIDPQSRVQLWRILRERHALGQTILLTTHHLEEAERLCDRVAIIDHGRVVACDTPTRLIDAAGGDTLLQVSYDQSPAAVARSVSEVAPAARAQCEGQRLTVFTPHPDHLLGVVVNLGVTAGLAVTGVEVHRPSLETAFLALTGATYRE
jgi:ABC-2 type transport system ATP-binding protein